VQESDRLKLKNLTLLYVEDNKRLVQEVNNVFDTIFNKVYTAHNGIEALEVLYTNSVDIVITDLHMPNMNGIDFIKEIRQLNKTLSIIILTAYADKDLLLEASNLQIDGYLTKPINFSKISATLSNALQRLSFATTYTLKNGAIYDVNTKELSYNDSHVTLGKKEAKLLDYLILNAQSVVSKEDIDYHIWDMDTVTESALKNLMSNLRYKIGKENIINHHGHGWKILLKN
jgi:DNA-binding response OmpR family regulator